MNAPNPYVCGAIGTWEQTRLDRLVAASPAARPVHADEHAALWSTSSLPKWQGTAEAGWLWSPLAAGSAPRSWPEAAERRLAAGLSIGTGGATLHTCGLGIQDLYTRRVNGAVYFATLIEPLLAVDDAALHTDWSAWGSILTVGGPLNDGTPFEEIRRMTAASGWHADSQGIRGVSFAPSWMEVEPTGCDPDEILSILRPHIPEHRGLGRSAVTLSGGFDSRLLAALATERSRRAVLAWTTSPDDGDDHDVELSRPVARALGMKQHVLIPGPDAFRVEREALYERVQHQTALHTWLMPLARTLHGRREPLLDGLAGDVLLRGFEPPILAAPSAEARLTEVWRDMASNGVPDDWFAPGVAKQFEAAGRDAFDTAAQVFDGHPAAPALIWLTTRTGRAIALSPLRLFGPEADVRLPFLHPDLILAALRLPMSETFEGAYYRRLLDATMGPAGALPSTNDPGLTKGDGQIPRRQRERAALAEMTAQVAADDVVTGLLGKELVATLTDPDERDRVCAFNGPRSALQWASMFAHWRAKYASRLAS